VLPQQWHGVINKHTSSLNVRKQGPTMVTSFNTPTPSARAAPSPHHSLFGSHSSFSPLNSSPNPSPVYGNSLYSPNPYVSPYAAVPQFVPPPTQFVPQQPQFVPQQPQFVPQQSQFVPQQPQFAPQLSPQGTVHVTNVYNTVQQPEKPSHGHNGTVQLLGGALKVAGALIPLFTGGNNNNNGGSLF
jgi:hypothetical protein